MHPLFISSQPYLTVLKKLLALYPSGNFFDKFDESILDPLNCAALGDFPINVEKIRDHARIRIICSPSSDGGKFQYRLRKFKLELRVFRSV